jgi:hypothetical protein
MRHLSLSMRVLIKKKTLIIAAIILKFYFDEYLNSLVFSPLTYGTADTKRNVLSVRDCSISS